MMNDSEKKDYSWIYLIIAIIVYALVGKSCGADNSDLGYPFDDQDLDAEYQAELLDQPMDIEPYYRGEWESELFAIILRSKCNDGS